MDNPLAITTVSPHRRPASGGYPRGEETRLRVIRMATAVFAERGFERASTREIAARAGVNPPALQYYFDSKLGLYRACMDMIANAIWRRIGPLIDEADALLAGEPSTKALIGTYCRLQDSILDSLFEPEEGEHINRLLMWESGELSQMDEARRLIRERIEHPITQTMEAIVGRVMGLPRTDPQVGLNAFAMSGLIMVFCKDADRARDTIGWRSADRDSVTATKRALRQQATWVLQGLAHQGAQSIA